MSCSAYSTDDRSLNWEQMPLGMALVESQAHKAWREANPEYWQEDLQALSHQAIQYHQTTRKER